MSQTVQVPGIHHVTAISGPAQQNVDFYAGVLGLRTVKQTVNFDDPGTHHLYYGDQAGTPGNVAVRALARPR
jgi:glyoxalase family protein